MHQKCIHIAPLSCSIGTAQEPSPWRRMNQRVDRPVKRTSVSFAVIAKHITAAIIDRRIPPGTKLGEVSLGEVFGVSRTKVRQALYQLAKDKLVNLYPGRGAFVAEPSVKEA